MTTQPAEHRSRLDWLIVVYSTRYLCYTLQKMGYVRVPIRIQIVQNYVLHLNAVVHFN